jgi:membrane-associated phospholipid phosphatase
LPFLSFSINSKVMVSQRREILLRIFHILAAVSISILACRASAQNPAENVPDAPTPQNQASDSTVTVRGTPLRILKDQEAIWTSPARIRESNALGPVVLVLGTAIVMTTDHQVMSSSKLQNPSLNDEASTASTGLLGGFVAAPVAIYGEAIVDSLAVSEVLKAISMRERPTVDSAKGRFFQTSVGLDSSFPSNHAMVAWSSAAVIASEYDGAMTQILAYGLATGVSATRVLARQHFPSDVLVGSAVGWMIGRYVELKHRRAN